MPTRTGSIALAAALFLPAVGAGLSAEPARAADCLAAPNAQAPKGSHWFYRLDRASQRKCWYLRAPGQAARDAAPAMAEAASAANSPSAPLALMPGDGALRPPQRAAAPRTPPTEAATTIETPQASPPEQTPVAPAPAPAQAWPDPRPSLEMLQTTEPGPRETPSAAPERPKADARVVAAAPSLSHEPQRDAAGTAGMWSITPLGMVLIGALALGMAGILTRTVVRIASARRRRVYVDNLEAGWSDDRRDPDWIDDQRRPDWNDDQRRPDGIDDPRRPDWVDNLPPVQAPSFALRPGDLVDAPDERISPDVEDIEAALRRLLHTRDRRVA